MGARYSKRLIAGLAGALLTLQAGCTSGWGTAELVTVNFQPNAQFDDRLSRPQPCAPRRDGPVPEPARYDQDPAVFGGLLRTADEDSAAAKTRYIFHTHGMGVTPRCDFTDSLLSALEERGYRRTQDPTPWIEAATRQTWHVRGDASACAGEAAGRPPCSFSSFGDYRFDRLTGPAGDRVVVVSYYWHRDLWRVQYPYLHDDLQRRPGYLTAKIKHETVDGGLGDAAAYLGPLGDPLREGMASAICAMLQDAADDPNPLPRGLDDCLTGDDARRIRSDVQFGFLSHSLGSRMLFDVLEGSWTLAPPVRPGRSSQSTEREVLAAQTTSFFMAANQLPLLGPGRVRVSGTPPPSSPGGVPEPCAQLPSFLALRCVLRETGARGVGPESYLDVIAFHDPGDLLGFRVNGGMAAAPNGIRFQTVRHRNTPQIAWLGSWPLSAHDQELERKTSLGLILCGGSQASGSLRPRTCGSAGD